MNDKNLYSQFDSETIIVMFTSFYKNEFGEPKFRKAIEKLDNNSNYKSNSARMIKLRQHPNSLMFLEAVHGVPYLVFAKPETKCCAALGAISLWRHDARLKGFFPDEDKVKVCVLDTIRKADSMKIHFGITFFDKFYKFVQDVVSGKENADKYM